MICLCWPFSACLYIGIMYILFSTKQRNKHWGNTHTHTRSHITGNIPCFLVHLFCFVFSDLSYCAKRFYLYRCFSSQEQLVQAKPKSCSFCLNCIHHTNVKMCNFRFLRIFVHKCRNECFIASVNRWRCTLPCIG